MASFLSLLSSLCLLGILDSAVAAGTFIDLTYALNNETVFWPGRSLKYNIEIHGYTPGGFWVSSRGICTSEHSATHIDAPYHFYEKGGTLDTIPLKNLIDVPGIMVDVYDKVHTYKDGKLNVINNYALTVEDLIEWERKHGLIPQGAVVLVRSGWGSRWPDDKLYKGTPDLPPKKTEEQKNDGGTDLPLDNDLSFPGIGGEAAKFLSHQRKIIGVGTDTLSIDRGISKKFPAHQVFAKEEVYMLENVANLHLLPPKGFRLYVVPFKIDKGTGAPTRVLALLKTNNSL